jgi:hypothetical protein
MIREAAMAWEQTFTCILAALSVGFVFGLGIGLRARELRSEHEAGIQMKVRLH